MSAIVLYQLASGKLLNLRWGIWLTRKEQPRQYWAVLVVELAVVLVTFYIGSVTLAP